ncbi:MAG: rhamnogalacturonan acetylesterase [Prolixibacteraceae bacterium]|nr:rhamnogalacturonan acetylesterase [Prolixibacteraceae bacterium]
MKKILLIAIIGLVFQVILQAKEKPTVFTIGDSTVKNGKGDGAGGQWGWGDLIIQYFDTTKVFVKNRALGGTSSRTFQTKGLWDAVLKELKKGDFVLMQFGHNDNGPVNDTLRARGTIKGIGEETEEIDNLITKQHEIVHSYGWYLRKIVQEAKTKGATPIIVTPIPRNDWENGKVKRTPASYPDWVMEIARQEKIGYIDLNERMSEKLDLLGENKVTGIYFFAPDHTHTSAMGASMAASLVADGIKANKKFGLNRFLLKKPAVDLSIFSAPSEFRFKFGSDQSLSGWTPVNRKSVYSTQIGFGIIPSGEMEEGINFLSSKKPFYFVVDLPEGHYQLILTLGGSATGSSTTLKAESRRLLFENVITEPVQTIQKTVVVDVRYPQMKNQEGIKLKDRELNYMNWDHKLTLEFNGKHPCVSAIEIKKADHLPTIFLAGNSTVTDQENEPWASWGQMFPNFLKPEVVVANYAESGETLLAFKRENRLQKILSQIKKGDYLFMEFAHNDQKPGGNHLDAMTTYKDELRYFIAETRKKGGTPVLVTSTNRRKFDENGKIINTLEEFPEAMRQLYKEENVPLIDLNAMSKQFYEALGVENSKKAFVHYPANSYSGQDKPLADDTHFNPYGAYELAKCVTQAVLQTIPDLAKYVRDDWKTFDPATPDPVAQFRWYDSTAVNLLKPDGN